MLLYINAYFMHNMMDWFIIHPIFMIVGMSVYFLVSFILAFVIYKDIIKKGLSNAGLWFIIILFLNVLGLVFYLLFAEPTPFERRQNRISTQSDHLNPLNQTSNAEIFCPHCGKRIPSYAQYCPQCGAPVV